jgi:hypothetical protein
MNIPLTWQLYLCKSADELEGTIEEFLTEIEELTPHLSRWDDVRAAGSNHRSWVTRWMLDIESSSGSGAQERTVDFVKTIIWKLYHARGMVYDPHSSPEDQIKWRSGSEAESKFERVLVEVLNRQLLSQI